MRGLRAVLEVPATRAVRGGVLGCKVLGVRVFFFF